MNVKEKIKETLVSQVVEKSFAAGAILILVAAVVLRDRMLPALSKELLAGMLVTSVTLLLLAGAYIFHLRKRLSAKLKYRFGVLWDEDQNPVCPKDKMRLQVKKTNNPYERFPDQFVCAGCDRSFELSDEEGFAIFTLNDARQKLASP